MTGLHKVFDASYPPTLSRGSCEGVLGYIGRPGYTPHVWTPEEWNRLYHLVQFPCWLPDFSVHAGIEADLIAATLNNYGWHGDGLAVIIDYETRGLPEAPWHANLADALAQKHGFTAVAYGSLLTVVQTEANHLWAADWDGNPRLDPAGQTVHAHQYLAGTAYDLSVADDWLMSHGLHRA